LARWDKGNRLSFLSLHDPQVGQDFDDLTHEQLMEQMYVIDPSGRRYGGAAAFRYLTRRLPRLWPLVPLLHIPFSLPLWQWLYRRIASLRYRLSRTTTCEIDACRNHLGK
jgi:predicted DCC family thiol-disulfide oxidoreductase YuxK